MRLYEKESKSERLKKETDTRTSKFECRESLAK